MLLKEYLERNDLSMFKFSRIVGVSHTTIANILKNKRPSPRNAQRIQDCTNKEVLARDLLRLPKRKYIVINQ